MGWWVFSEEGDKGLLSVHEVLACALCSALFLHVRWLVRMGVLQAYVTMCGLGWTVAAAACVCLYRSWVMSCVPSLLPPRHR